MINVQSYMSEKTEAGSFSKKETNLKQKPKQRACISWCKLGIQDIKFNVSGLWQPLR